MLFGEMPRIAPPPTSPWFRKSPADFAPLYLVLTNIQPALPSLLLSVQKSVDYAKHLLHDGILPQVISCLHDNQTLQINSSLPDI